MRLTNDNMQLVPRTSFDGPTLDFDFPSLRIGVAEYEEGPTGCTVFHFPNKAFVSVDIRGGSPGVMEHGYGDYDAICFAGGSLLGLEAAAGVRAEVLAMQDYSISWDTMPLVSGAIIWDWGRKNTIYPDKELGRAALKCASTGTFPIGPRGAGRSAGCGPGFAGVAREATGQGGAFRQVGPTKIAVFTVVNAVGVIVNRQGQVVRGHIDPKTGKRYSYAELLERRIASKKGTESPKGNTTLTLVITNQKLEQYSQQQIGRQVHCSMARAIQPFHTRNDGDVLYMVTTNEVRNRPLNEMALGVLASELAWDAVLSIVQKYDLS
jgi:L-aminopeptidase/D-esterase-like protein